MELPAYVDADSQHCLEMSNGCEPPASHIEPCGDAMHPLEDRRRTSLFMRP